MGCCDWLFLRKHKNTTIASWLGTDDSSKKQIHIVVDYWNNELFHQKNAPVTRTRLESIFLFICEWDLVRVSIHIDIENTVVSFETLIKFLYCKYYINTVILFVLNKQSLNRNSLPWASGSFIICVSYSAIFHETYV